MTTSGPDEVPTSSGAASPPANETKSPFRITTALRNAAVILAVSLVLVEVALRLLGLSSPVLYERDPDVGYRLKPDQRISYLRNAIVINAYGVRDPRPLDTRDPGEKRVLCLGDSVTWGGIYERQEDLFTSVAERKLGNVEIVNAGVNGYSMTQMARLYEKHLTGLNPDLVVFCALVRDFERPPSVQLTGDGVAFPIEKPRSAIVEALKICQLTAYSRWDWEWLRPPSATVPVEVSDTIPEGANLDYMLELSNRLNGRQKFAVVFLPVETGSARARMRRNFALALRQRGAHAVDLSSTVAMGRNDFVDNVHLSTAGHRKIGAALAVVIYDELTADRANQTPP